MPSFASFSKPLTVGQGRDKKSYPPTAMKAPVLPEPLHLDTTDFLASVQSIPSPLDKNNYYYPEEEHLQLEDPKRPAWHTKDPYSHGEPGFSGGHQYKVERMEEKRRLRSLGLLSGTTTPQTDPLPPVTMTSPAKPEAKRRGSWQPPFKGKLQKARNKSREPEGRKSFDAKYVQPENQSPLPQNHPQYSFSRIYTSPGPSIGSPCATPSPMMTPTRELGQPRPPFSQVGRSSSSLGTMIGVATTTPSPSLGNLVDFYDPNSPGHAYTTAPSTPMVPLHSQASSQNTSPVGYQRFQYPTQNESPVDPATPPLFSGRLANTPRDLPTAKPPAYQPFPPTTPLNTSLGGSSRGNSTTSLNSPASMKPDRPTVDKPAYKPYEPKYAAKSHVTSTVPLSQTVNQDQVAIPFVHLDFSGPPKPFARNQIGQHKSNSETRLTTQEAKDYNAIAQATREAHVRIQSPSEASLVGKANQRPQLTPSRLSYEVRNISTPDSQTGRVSLPPKSILRKPVELPAEDYREEPVRRQPPSLQTSARTTPEPFKAFSKNLESEPVSPIAPPVEIDQQPERGRSMFKRGEESGSEPKRRPSVSARKSIDVETPSAKNFDISKYTQERFSKPAHGKTSRAYPPVSYKAPTPQVEPPPNPSPEREIPVPPVPPLPELAMSVRGLSTPPPIRYDNAIESSDDESLERPSTAAAEESRRTSEPKGKSKLSSNVTTIESAPARPRAPSMTEILKDLHKFEADDGVSPEAGEANDWLSQLFRGKKTDVKLPSRPSSGVSTPVSMSSPQLNNSKPYKKSGHSRNSSRELAAQEQIIHDRAERQRLEVERKLAEAENSEPSSTPRSPRFPRPSVSVTASPDLRVVHNDASSLRTASTTSVDRLDPVVGGSSNLGKAEEIPEGVVLSADEKKSAQDRKRRPSSAEVRKQLGEMTPPHEREDWEVNRNSQSSFSSIPQITAPATVSPSIAVAPLNLPTKSPVAKLLPLANDPSPSTSTSSRMKDSLSIDTSSPNSSLLSLEATKTLTKIMVVCCNCSRLHDPPTEVYRRMVQGNSHFKCPYCLHGMDVLDCCSAYTSICNLIEKLH